MPGPPGGVLLFPGVQNVLAWTFTMSHGIQPSVAQLRITPQDTDIPTTPQTMSILFGDLQLDFANCIVDTASISADPDSPQIVSLAIKDRRWRWQYGSITGRYNLRFSDGTIDVSTRKTTQELASLLLDRMGETGYDVSAMSTLPYPETDWDHSVPAQELEQLAEFLGCHVVLRLDGTVQVALIGAGANLPDSPDARTVDYGIDPPDRPDTIRVVGGPTRYQTIFRLRAVGQEKDTINNPKYNNDPIQALISGDIVQIGKIVPIEQLSYAPKPGTSDGGWTDEWMSHRAFASIASPSLITATNPKGLDLEARKKALESVYRWYQISDTDPILSALDAPSSGIINILGYSENPVKPWQCCPLEEGLVQAFVENVAVLGVPPTGQTSAAEHPLPPVLWGRWHQEKPDFGVNNTPRAFPYSFTVDRERGIVKLPFPVVRINANDATKPFLPADLFLIIGHSVINASTRQPDRFTLTRDLGGRLGTGPLILKREDVVRRIICGVSIADMSMRANSQALSDTNDSATTEANYYMDAYQASLQAPQTSHIEYNGILPISCDGRIAQVEWTGGPGGAITKASANNEFSLHVPSYQERREIGRVRSQVYLVNKIAAHMRRWRAKHRA